jgi:hypothetical protein
VEGGGGGRAAFFAAGFFGAAFAFAFVFAFDFEVAAFFCAGAGSPSSWALSPVSSRLRFLVVCSTSVSGVPIEAAVGTSGGRAGSSVDGESNIRAGALCNEPAHGDCPEESDMPDGLATRTVSTPGVQAVVAVSEVRNFSSEGGTIVDGAEERGEVSCDEETRGGVFGAISWPDGVDK